MAAAQYQRDHEHGSDGLETILQSPDVRRIWQTAGLGTGRFRQRTARQRRWICGADRGRMPPAGTSEGVERVKMVDCCRDGCHLVAGSVAGDFPVWIREKPVSKGYFNSLFISGNESNEIFQENSQSKIYRPDGSLQVFRGSLPDFVAGAAVRPVSLWR